MYIWVAVDVNEQVRELREAAESYMEQQGLSSATFTLPFHISLKISFQIPNDRAEEVVGDIRDLYRSLKPFQITVGGIERLGTLVWIRMQESAALADIHKKLDEMLLEKYGVIQHELDKDYIFHTSVVRLYDEEQTAKALETLSGVDLPETLRAESFIIGSSKDGRADTYSVIEEIKLV